MKRIALVLVVAAFAAAVNAQAPAPQKDGEKGTPPQDGKAVEATVSGVLAFVDDRPAIKADSGMILLAMPDFYKYAYIDGFKAGQTVKASGMLVVQPSSSEPAAQGDKTGESVLIAREVTIGARTYVVVRGAPDQCPEGRCGPGGDRGPLLAPRNDQQPKSVDSYGGGKF
jgi:hypothetical protein